MPEGHHLVRSLFDDESYRHLFNQLLSTTHAVEYYMVDNSGSFIFLDKDAKPTWLIVRHANEFQDQLELLQRYDGCSSIISSISRKEKILFLPSENEYKKPIAEWANYMFEAKPLNDDYHFSIVHDHITNSIKWDDIVPYSKVTLSTAINF